ISGAVEPDRKPQRSKSPLPFQRKSKRSEVAHLEITCHNTQKDKPFSECQNGDDKRKYRRLITTQQIDQGEYEIADNSSNQNRNAGIQKMGVASQCKGNSRRREYKFDDGRVAGNQSANGTERFIAVCKRTTSMWNRRRQISKAEDESHIHQR